MAFFKLAVEAGFTVEKIWEEVMEKVMFERDIGVSLGRVFNFYFRKHVLILYVLHRMSCYGGRFLDTSFDGRREN